MRSLALAAAALSLLAALPADASLGVPLEQRIRLSSPRPGRVERLRAGADGKGPSIGTLRPTSNPLYHGIAKSVMVGPAGAEKFVGTVTTGHSGTVSKMERPRSYLNVGDYHRNGDITMRTRQGDRLVGRFRDGKLYAVEAGTERLVGAAPSKAAAAARLFLIERR